MDNNKLWIQQTIAHQETQKIPYNFDFSPPAQAAVAKYYRTENIEEKLNLPIRMADVKSIKPIYADPDEHGPVIRDEFGVIWSTNKIDRGAPIGPCLSNPSLTDYVFPDPKEEYRYEGIGNWCNHNAHHFTLIWVGDLWERATFMRGMNDLLLDTAVNINFVEVLIKRIADYIMQTMKILFERFKFDCIALSDDYGSQKTMLMSPRTWRNLVKPCLSDIFRLAKENSRYIFLHSCGNIEPIIPDLIDIGLDILHPVQPEAMDPFEIKKKYGDDLTFCGGIGTQRLLPYGTTDEIRRKIRELKDIMGQGGGYIIEPGITIQSDVPLANVIAMIDEVVA